VSPACKGREITAFGRMSRRPQLGCAMAAGVMGLGAGAPVAAAGASARTNVVVTLIDDIGFPTRRAL
jgi:hypothetical protein